jgi:hypothetical protein
MKAERPIDPRHEAIRGFLQVVGPLVAFVGLAFTVVGLVSFFSSFGSFQPPRYFWCAFVGLPLLAIGSTMIKAAYLGGIFRYLLGEVAPVQKDTFNYLAEGTSEGVGHLARAVGQGFAAGASGFSTQPEVACPQCQATNPAVANFCGHCGAPLGTTCPGCGGRSDPEARFCARCGHALG